MLSCTPQTTDNTLCKGIFGMQGGSKMEGMSFPPLTFTCFLYQPRLTACPSKEMQLYPMTILQYGFVYEQKKTNLKFCSPGQMVDLLMRPSLAVLTSEGYESLMLMAAQLLKATGYTSVAYFQDQTVSSRAMRRSQVVKNICGNNSVLLTLSL